MFNEHFIVTGFIRNLHVSTFMSYPIIILTVFFILCISSLPVVLLGFNPLSIIEFGGYEFMVGVGICIVAAHVQPLSISHFV